MRLILIEIGYFKECKNKLCNNTYLMGSTILMGSIMILNIISLTGCSRSVLIHPRIYPTLCINDQMVNSSETLSEGIYIIDQRDHFILSVINQQTDQESIITLDQKMIKTSQHFIEGRLIYIEKSQYCLLPIHWSTQLQKNLKQKLIQLSSPDWVQFSL